MTEPAEPAPLEPTAFRTIQSADGTPLHLREWAAPGARALVRIVHGLGEHGGRYRGVAAALAAHGISSAAVDLRGHGASGGRRGHADRFGSLLADVEAMVGATATDLPPFLLGHSLGGLIALRAVQEGRGGEPRGLILSAPALRLAHGGSPLHRAVAALLRPLLPRLPLSNGIDPADISRDPEAVRAYRNDPLVHDRITPSLYLEMLGAMRAAEADAARVRLPVLLLAPGADRITRVEAAIGVAGRFTGPVEVRRYDGYFHEPFNEIGRGRVLADLTGWTVGQLG